MRSSLALVVLLAVLGTSAGCASRFVVTQPFDVENDAPLFLHVAPLGLALPLDTLENKKPRPEELQKLERWIHSELTKASLTPEDPGSPIPYQVQGSILQFRRGNGFLRFFGLFGLGSAKTVAQLKVVESSTGRVVFGGNYAGRVDGWSFGENAFRDIAKMFVLSFVRGMRTAPSPAISANDSLNSKSP